jgi:hypothetical protein
MKHQWNRSAGACAILAAATVLLAGCGIGSERKSAAEMKAQDLERQKATVNTELERCRIENRQLADQIRALSALPKEGRENLYELRAVKIAKYTNWYDQDEDGKREKLIVYFQPIDTVGDVVKAAGSVAVQLWNLNDPNSQAMLGQWQVQPAELRKLWYASIVTSTYRLTFDVPAAPAQDLTALQAQPLTVRITFTDYLTGKIFHDQQVIEP